MITDGLVAIFSFLLQPIFDRLPVFSLREAFSLGTVGVPRLGYGGCSGADMSGKLLELCHLGGRVRWLDSVLPLGPLLFLTSIVVSWILPGILIYTLANWVYRHIPQLGGFGPGAG